MKNFYIFIQARIRSKRLPGKIFINIFNESVIDRIIRSCKEVVKSKNIYLLTGNKSNPHILKNVSKKHNINFFSGDEKNVLKRFCNNIMLNKITNSNIIRITADNYLIQPMIIKKQIQVYKDKNLISEILLDFLLVDMKEFLCHQSQNQKQQNHQL